MLITGFVLVDACTCEFIIFADWPTLAYLYQILPFCPIPPPLHFQKSHPTPSKLKNLEFLSELVLYRILVVQPFCNAKYRIARIKVVCSYSDHIGFNLIMSPLKPPISVTSKIPQQVI